jgi:hypothetical protein
MKSVAERVHKEHLIISSQARARRWLAYKQVAAMRLQVWYKHTLWSRKQMVKVRAEVRDATRNKKMKEKVSGKIKASYTKVWDVANARYQYKHRKMPGIVLTEKPDILGDDDVLTPRSRRRKNWAEATGGREELNEIEAAHVIEKFMKSLLFKDAGGFLISQQWYGKWKLDQRPGREGCALIIQKIVRHQMQRWGGPEKFGKRVSHNHDLMKRRLKAGRVKGRKAGGGLTLANSKPQFEVRARTPTWHLSTGGRARVRASSGGRVRRVLRAGGRPSEAWERSSPLPGAQEQLYGRGVSPLQPKILLASAAEEQQQQRHLSTGYLTGHVRLAGLH